MDPVQEIKMRLPIEELVGQYCQLMKKGRQFVCLCPFHNDSKPSLQVSPEKGIAYCFACNSGGDIFSFYQQIEGVDFRQAVKDLAEKAGVKLDVGHGTQDKGKTVKKDEKERLRECLEAALKFYKQQFEADKSTQEYVQKRAVTPEVMKQFTLGVAPNSYSATYDHLLKAGFSRTEIVTSGLAIQKDLDGKTYDRFRHRLMFPIHDHQGRLIGFGGRTLGDDDAKYINSAESPLYNKSHVLYGLHAAKEQMRSEKRVILVEGYFDVLACHQVGVTNTVAVCGTALTPEHVRFLKRYVETIVLCLDQDRAGKDAAERAFQLCAAEGLQVNIVTLNEKDPGDMVQEQPELLAQLLSDAGVPYLDQRIADYEEQDTSSIQGKRAVLGSMLPLLHTIPSAVVRNHYIAELAKLLSSTVAAVEEDLFRVKQQAVTPIAPKQAEPTKKSSPFSSVEVALALFMLYPEHKQHLQELIAPPEGFALSLYEAINAVAEDLKNITPELLDVEADTKEKVGILLLYCEQYGFNEWSTDMALREIRKNVQAANRDTLNAKLKEITAQLVAAQKEGKTAEAQKLSTQYQQVLKLAKMVK